MMNKQSNGGARFRPGAALGLLLGLAMVVTCLVIAGRPDAERKPGYYRGAASRPHRHDTYYNRLKADFRSLVAVVHYLLEPEDASVTNPNFYVAVTNQSVPSLAMPTNYSRRLPAV